MDDVPGWVKTIWAALVLMLPPISTWLAKVFAERAVEKKFREWEVRFSKLHERRVEVMDELQDHLIDVKHALDKAAGIKWNLEDPDGVEHINAAAEAGMKAHRCLATRRYYLPKKAAKRVGEVLEEMRSIQISILTGVEGKLWGDIDPASDALVSNGYKGVREKLPALFDLLEQEFRSLVDGS